MSTPHPVLENNCVNFNVLYVHFHQAIIMLFILRYNTYYYESDWIFHHNQHPLPEEIVITKGPSQHYAN